MRKMILDCEKCGGTLEVTEEMELFKCEFCGMPYMVELSDGGMRVTRLEARVAKVEDEQEKVRFDLVTSRIQQVHNEIEEIYDGLSSAHYDRVHEKFQKSTVERLYREELELRPEYSSRGGSEPAILDFVNLLEIISCVAPLFPRTSLEVWYARERVRLFGSDLYCPGLAFASWSKDPSPSIIVKRQSSEILIRHIHRPGGRKRTIAVLQKRYPHRVVK